MNLFTARNRLLISPPIKWTMDRRTISRLIVCLLVHSLGTVCSVVVISH